MSVREVIELMELIAAVGTGVGGISNVGETAVLSGLITDVEREDLTKILSAVEVTGITGVETVGVANIGEVTRIVGEAGISTIVEITGIMEVREFEAIGGTGDFMATVV